MATIEQRRQSDGTIMYRVKVRLKGHPAQFASFKRLTDARLWAQSTEAAIREGRYFKTSESKRHTLAEAIARYTKEVMPSKPGSASQIFQLAWWSHRIGAYAFSDITPALLSECREHLLRDPVPSNPKHCINKAGTRRRKPGTVVRYFAVLSHLFTIAIKEWQWCEDNPVRKISKPKEPRGRVRFLSDAERESLLEACRHSSNSNLYLVVVLAISTGMRQGELMTLRWNQIDFDRGAITLHITKNGDRRRVFLAGLALQLLLAHARVRRIDSDCRRRLNIDPPC